ncbi:hypothetical protein OG508_27990 [Streptomyces sp. NBC_01108]|uniref:hypothetical protein n=1 Tax=Streptomyces sp. NBC_01108 TaxID=2903751 RepID=UPI003873321F|nr:hypothetical protein OG508_27990 [Streptomyces sp. NBC_01108]
MIAQTEPVAAPDAAYRALIGHTYNCATCRAGASCPTAVQLDRAWRAVRGPMRKASR